eukprot:1180295-Prymnesium_polylepis.1
MQSNRAPDAHTDATTLAAHRCEAAGDARLGDNVGLVGVLAQVEHRIMVEQVDAQLRILDRLDIHVVERVLRPERDHILHPQRGEQQRVVLGAPLGQRPRFELHVCAMLR